MIVVDVGQEAFVFFFVEIPVYVMNGRIIEFVHHLLPGMVKDIFSFLRFFQLHFGSKSNRRKKADKKEGKKKEEKKKEEDSKLPKLTIDFNNLEDRIARLTINSSNLGDAVLTKDGSKLYYLASFEGGYDLWVRDFKEGSTRILSKLNKWGGALEMDKEGKNLFLLAG